MDDSLEVEYAYDGDGLLVQAGDLLLERDTLNGRLVAAELDSVRSEWSYSARGELERLREWWGATLLFEQEYERDELGRITQVTEVIQGDTLTRSYDYDGVGRLVEVRVRVPQMSRSG